MTRDPTSARVNASRGTHRYANAHARRHTRTHRAISGWATKALPHMAGSRLPLTSTTSFSLGLASVSYASYWASSEVLKMAYSPSMLAIRGHTRGWSAVKLAGASLVAARAGHVSGKVSISAPYRRLRAHYCYGLVYLLDSW